MIDTDRSALRAALRERRRALPPTARFAAAEAMAERLRPRLGRIGYLAGYWAMDGELPLHAVLRGTPPFVYCLPVLQAGRSLRFAAWRPGDPLQPNRYGIPEPPLAPSSLLEPTALDVVLLPLLGFDRHGNRLGTGGGYYDRSFAFLRGRRRPARPRLIGVGYACQEVAALPAAEWDVGLDAIVTECEWIDCVPGPCPGNG